METKNSREISLRLSSFKNNFGSVDHKLTLSVPGIERIPCLIQAKDGRMRVSAVINASLVSAFNNMSVKYGMDDDQTFELAEAIIDTSFEDNLSLEDILLFLNDLVRGKRGEIGYKMDMSTFFKLFEGYRQERWVTLQDVRYEQHAQNKIMGRGEGPRMTHDVDVQTFFELYKDLRGGDDEETSGND
jgi:hypothetical protein